MSEWGVPPSYTLCRGHWDTRRGWKFPHWTPQSSRLVLPWRRKIIPSALFHTISCCWTICLDCSQRLFLHLNIYCTSTFKSSDPSSSIVFLFLAILPPPKIQMTLKRWRCVRKGEKICWPKHKALSFSGSFMWKTWDGRLWNFGMASLNCQSIGGCHSDICHPIFCIICHPSFVSFATPYWQIWIVISSFFKTRSRFL